MSNYIKKTEDSRTPLDINYDWVQSFHIKPSNNKSVNEGQCIRNFINAEKSEKDIAYAIMVFLYKFVFATGKQIVRYLNFIGFGCTDDYAENIISIMTKEREINYFFISDCPLPLNLEPKDGEKFYCLDLAGRYVLASFYSEDVIFWKMVDTIRGTEIIQKHLSTAELYLAVLEKKREKIRAFEPSFVAGTGVRNIIFSAYMEISTEHRTKRFIIESVRKIDVPIYFRKKVTEQIDAFIMEGHWKRYLRSQPEFIFICENMEIANECAEIYYNFFKLREKPHDPYIFKNDYYVTTDEEIAKGIDNAVFYRFIENKTTGEVVLRGGKIGILSGD